MSFVAIPPPIPIFLIAALPANITAGPFIDDIDPVKVITFYGG
jgi:hypothetical protein